MVGRTPLLIALGGLLVGSAARADCQTDGVEFFPAPGSVVPTNARFILEGVGSEQKRVSALIGQQLVFKAADDLVTAKVLKGWRSDDGRLAVLIIPNHTFRPNKRYALALAQTLPNYVLLNDTADSPIWDSGRTPDDTPPHWRRKPAVSGGQYNLDSGKVASFVEVDMQLEEESPAYLVVTAQRAHGSTASQTYFAPVRDGKALLGHDACSGGFVFEEGQAYRATVVGYDIAGNAAANVPALDFRAPKPVR